MIEKHVVTDENGNPTELRYYEDGKLSARLQIVLDDNGNFISLRELSTEAVSPESWLEKLGLKKREPKRISINTIDFIGLINWINTIKTIKTINTIENINQIASLGTLNKVNDVALIDNITNIGTLNKVNDVALIDSITNLGTLNQLNTIQQINKINPSATENVVIDRIAKIDNITDISNIGTVANLDVGFVRVNPIQNPRFTSGFEGWRNPDPANIIVEDDTYFRKRVKMSNTTYTLTQYFFVSSNIWRTFCLWAFKPTTNGSDLYYNITYTDGTSTSGTFTLTTSWARYTVALDVGKIISGVSVGLVSNTGTVYFTMLSLVDDNIREVKQATRTNLKVQNEREDLITKSWDLTAGTTVLLSAVSGQRHKIYGWDYEADTDGANEFSATIGGVTVKFGRRKTKGVHAMGLPHPIVCDVNTALNFISAGNTSLSLRYVTEA